MFSSRYCPRSVGLYRVLIHEHITFKLRRGTSLSARFFKHNGDRNLLFDEEGLQKIIASSNITNNPKNNSSKERPKGDEIKEGVREAKHDKELDSDRVLPTEAQLYQGHNGEDNSDIAKELTRENTQSRNRLVGLLEEYLESIRVTLNAASQIVNDVTGYSAIEKSKDAIKTLESKLQEEKDHIKQSKEAYSDAISKRSMLQKEMNNLLSRKHEWTSNELERFTDLYRNDHTNEQRVINTQNTLAKAEQAAETTQLNLTRQILTRYHEEQVWSDKVRRLSTWGTWAIMTVNLLIFLIATLVVEPWKRSRLLACFEGKVKETINENSNKEVEALKSVILQSTIHTNLNSSVIPSDELALDREEKPHYSDVKGISFLHQMFYRMKSSFFLIYTNLFKSDKLHVMFNKEDFYLACLINTFLGCILGSLFTWLFS